MFEKPGSYLFKIKCATEQVVCSLQGVLAQAKNGDELCCEKFHAADGKARGALLFPFKFLGGRVEEFFL
jgi:hypothetical protein